MREFHIWVARVFLIGLAVFAVYYFYKFIYHTGGFAFSGSERWQAASGLDDDVVVGFGQRLLYFSIWLPTVLATEAMILSAMWLVILFLRGTYFEPPTVRALQWVGVSAVVAGVTMLAAMALNPWVLTMSNVTLKVWPPNLRLESGEVGLTLAGLGLFLLGRVLHLTVMIDRENKEFV